MNKMKNKKMTFAYVQLKSSSWLFLCIILLFSCDDNETEEYQLSRLFSPISFSASVELNVVSLSWVPINEAIYVLEISKDSLLFEHDLQTIPLDKNVEYLLENLWSSTRYSARIKAVSNDPSIADSKFTAITFKTGIENIFYAASPGDTSVDKITLRWDNTKLVTSIVVSKAGIDDFAIHLSENDIAEGKKVIAELTENSVYTFRIYLGEMLRGTMTVSTLSPQ